MKQKVKSSPARRAMKLLCTLLGLILAVMVSATVYVQYLTGQIDFSGFEKLSFLSQLSSGGISGDGSSQKDPDRIGGRGSGIVNILLVGQDSFEGEGQTRSDSMILCSFNKATHQLTMTSFLRDLYVPIPGHGSNRINAAYSFGGSKLLTKTLDRNFDVHIDGCVEVDFTRFPQIVDLLGGVEMELRGDEAAHINKATGSSLEEGIQTLNGEQALAYARIRKLDADGDFSRTNRQRKILSVLLSTYRSASLPSILALMDDILPMIETDMSALELVKTALELFPMLSDIQVVSQHIPAEGTYENRSIDGMSVLAADMEKARQLLRSSLYGE